MVSRSDSGTYATGFRLRCERDVRRRDIVQFCNWLSRQDEFLGRCTFEPESITEGGIVYRFSAPEHPKWYKSVRLRCYPRSVRAKAPQGPTERRVRAALREEREMEGWPWIHGDAMEEWRDSDATIFAEGEEIQTVLKSFHGAPAFTEEELIAWEHGLCLIGVRVAKRARKCDLRDPENAQKRAQKREETRPQTCTLPYMNEDGTPNFW